MSLIYALVAREKTVLAEFTSTTGNFPTVTRMLLSKIPPDVDGRMSYVYDGATTFHYIVDSGITYLCMSSEMVKRRIPFAFLEDVKTRFKQQFGDAVYSSIPFALNEEFSPVLRRQLDYYNHDPSSDRISAVKSELNDVKGTMVHNIEKVLERGERIELLVDKTDRLNQTSFKFEKSSRQLKQQMWWRQIRSYVIGAAAALVGLYIVSASLCGPTMETCRALAHHS